MRVLNFTHWAMKKARNHELIKGKRIIGRGAFSAVFDGSRSTTVYKLICDSLHYALLCDGCVAVKHPAFPKVIKDFGQIGEAYIAGEYVPLYLIEIERLYPLKTSPKARAIAKRLSYDLPYKWHRDSNIPDSVRKQFDNRTITALEVILDFKCYFPDAKPDFHSGNFMARKNGALVFSDPIADMRLYNKVTRSNWR